ncbi:hypothetical protein VTI28DRAFT_4142 [Corynascus sepedonium]
MTRIASQALKCLPGGAYTPMCFSFQWAFPRGDSPHLWLEDSPGSSAVHDWIPRNAEPASEFSGRHRVTEPPGTGAAPCRLSGMGLLQVELAPCLEPCMAQEPVGGDAGGPCWLVGKMMRCERDLPMAKREKWLSATPSARFQSQIWTWSQVIDSVVIAAGAARRCSPGLHRVYIGPQHDRLSRQG